MLFVGEGDVALIVGLLVVAGGAMGCGNVLSASIMADIIDADARRTGERREGIYSASMMFAMKIGISLATAASGVALSAVGFVPNAEQAAESLFAIRMLFAGLPCIGFLTGALVFRRSRLAADDATAVASTEPGAGSAGHRAASRSAPVAPASDSRPERSTGSGATSGA